MNPATDYMGREIKAGDTLVYPVRRGSNMWLNRILVTQVLPDAVTGHNTDAAASSSRTSATPWLSPPPLSLPSETMPAYEYQCDACGHRFEVTHGMNESGPRKKMPPSAPDKLRKVIRPCCFPFALLAHAPASQPRSGPLTPCVLWAGSINAPGPLERKRDAIRQKKEAWPEQASTEVMVLQRRLPHCLA